MELKYQVVSLELAKKLKELGVAQNSVFYYDETDKLLFVDDDGGFKDWVSAFTVAELGEILPSGVRTIKTRGNKGKWIALKWIKDKKVNFNADTEANARAKTLIYLF